MGTFPVVRTPCDLCTRTRHTRRWTSSQGTGVHDPTRQPRTTGTTTTTRTHPPERRSTDSSHTQYRDRCSPQGLRCSGLCSRRHSRSDGASYSPVRVRDHHLNRWSNDSSWGHEPLSTRLGFLVNSLLHSSSCLGDDRCRRSRDESPECRQTSLPPVPSPYPRGLASRRRLSRSSRPGRLPDPHHLSYGTPCPSTRRPRFHPDPCRLPWRWGSRGRSSESSRRGRSRLHPRSRRDASCRRSTPNHRARGRGSPQGSRTVSSPVSGRHGARWSRERSPHRWSFGRTRSHHPG